jgi:hypothetical protein
MWPDGRLIELFKIEHPLVLAPMAGLGTVELAASICEAGGLGSYGFGEIAVPQKLFGGCTCGAIRYECHADPVIMLNCHCRDCQRASGSAYAAIVAVPKPAVQIKGQLHYHKIVGRTGRATERGFCPSCGSPITVTSERRPDVLGLQAASLDDPSTYKPVMDVFICSAQPWDKMDPKMQKHTHGYPDQRGLS